MTTKKSARSVLDPQSPVSASVNKFSQIKSKEKPSKTGSVKKATQLYKSRGKLLGRRASSLQSPKSAPLHALSRNKSQKKISKKNQNQHTLIFEKNGLPNGTEVSYISKGEKLLEGFKVETGIFCHHCNRDVSPSVFEVHAGCLSRRKPYSYIYISKGMSLHEYARELKDKNNSLIDNDGLCIICADGGNLLLCDGCCRSFHEGCASFSSQTVPGKTYCKLCQNMFQRKKILAAKAKALAAGRVSGVDVLGQITERHIRIVKNPEASKVIACVLCRGYDFRQTGFGPDTSIICDQCEAEYHVGCLKKHEIDDLKELPSGEWFCCSDCNRIHSTMQNLLVSGPEKLSDSLLYVNRKKHIDKGFECVTNIDVRWRLLSAKISSHENRSLLSEACAIFHECFDPIVDSLSGRDYIPAMVYGLNIEGHQDFSGMYCAVLTVNSTVVSAGLVRIFGRDVAELPLVATTKDSQGRGYFQMLFSCIERLLGFLGVQSFVLPAAEKVYYIWTQKFGFKKIPKEQLNNYRKRHWQMLTFQGSAMLEKAVPQCRSTRQDMVVKEVSYQDISVTEVSNKDIAVFEVSNQVKAVAKVSH